MRRSGRLWASVSPPTAGLSRLVQGECENLRTMVTADDSAGSRSWHVVVPVKDTRQGKSRLAPPGAARTRLSRAIAEDTLSATVEAVGAGLVWLVTSDEGLSRDWARAGVHVVDDPGRGLNAAIAAGLSHLPDGVRRAALLGDLPSLTAVDLLAALRSGEHVREWFVPDAEGSGTVLRAGTLFVPRFGAASAAAHARHGATRLDLDLPRLRRDVDDLPSLAAATRLDVGPATSAVLGLSRVRARHGAGG